MDQKNLNINNFLKSLKEFIGKTSVTFDHSEFVPTTNEIPNMVRDLLTNLMADSKSVGFKMSLSGNISSIKEFNKKQSFCSDFNQMIKNILGLIGFEFSKYLTLHMGTFVMIQIIIEDIKLKASTYEDILKYFQMIYSLLKSVPNSKYKFEDADSSENKSSKTINQNLISFNPRAINKNMIIPDDRITEYFESKISCIKSLISTKDISEFDINKSNLLIDINKFISSIVSGTKSIESPNDLIIMNLGEYEILYDGSFIKIFEILYKSIHADNPRFNDKNIQSLIGLKLIEDCMDSIGLMEKSADQYRNYLESYFSDIYKKTISSLKSDLTIAELINKMEVQITVSLITAMAKITLCVFMRMIKLLNWKRDTMLLTSSPSRIQFSQVLESILFLPSGIDYSFTEKQFYVICYILTSKLGKQNKKNKNSRKD